MAPKPAASPASSASTYESASASDNEEEVAPPQPPKSAAAPKPPAAAPKPDSSSGESDSGSSDDEAAPPPPKRAAAAAAAESGSETGSDSDDEPAAAATPKPPAAATPAAASSSSGDESGSGDDSESDSDAAPAAPPRHSVRVADPAVKPLASKPMPPKPAAASETPAAKQFHRIWSDEDEIALLTGIVDYKASTGILPSSNSEIEVFRDFIRKSVRVEVTTTQLGDKVRHLKRKYDTRTKTPPPTFTKPHDAAVYELSQKVWGVKRDRGENGDASGSRVKKRQKSGDGRAKVEKEVAVVAVDEGGDDAAAAAMVEAKVRYPYFTDAVLRMGDSVQSRLLVKEAIERVDDVKATALERKYKKLKLQQMKSNVRELDLNKEALKAVTDAMEKFV